MNPRKPFRKFQAQQNKIEDLEKSNSRFKRIYSEYENMSEQLWNIENLEGDSIPDDFLNAIKLQTSYLEDEIQDWLYESDHKNVE